MSKESNKVRTVQLHTRARILLLWTGLLGAFAGCESNPDFAAFQAADDAKATPRHTSSWPSYAGDNSAKFAPLRQIDKSNVSDLSLAWTYRLGDIQGLLQGTPIIADGQLVACSPRNKVVALDPLTGAELWRFDAKIKPVRYANDAKCRALAQWQSSSADAEICSSRLLMATNDARLIALDTRSGQPCADFGDDGEISLSDSVGATAYAGEYQVTSAPAVSGDVVIVGSAVGDNMRSDAPSGVVRGFDVRSGKIVWAFDLAPPGFDYQTEPVSKAGYALGTPNVWAGLVVDDVRDMVFLPTGNPSPDYYRFKTPDLSHFSSSVVALRASTGEYLWHFQTVINDFWDFDVPSMPALADIRVGDDVVPGLIQSTKMGFVFVLNRDTGKPIFQVTYDDVPQFGPLEHLLSPVQPFPPKAFQVSQTYRPGNSPLGLCDGLEKENAIGPVYTPIGEDWTIGLPSNMGATNWGGVAVDSTRGLVALHTNSLAFRTRLVDKKQAPTLFEMAENRALPLQKRKDNYVRLREKLGLSQAMELGLQEGMPYAMVRELLMDPYLGIVPCGGQPFNEVLVLDLNDQTQRWRRPHGRLKGLARSMGIPGMGGPLLTESGLLFLGGTAEPSLYAYDVESGEELWRHKLPHGANASPMSVAVADDQGKMRQMVVVAAGGDHRVPLFSSGDYLLAFALPHIETNAATSDESAGNR